MSHRFKAMTGYSSCAVEIKPGQVIGANKENHRISLGWLVGVGEVAWENGCEDDSGGQDNGDGDDELFVGKRGYDCCSLPEEPFVVIVIAYPKPRNRVAIEYAQRSHTQSYPD
jgi:hypothetical protein